ncbi:hypothetical protein PM082_007020 [Marasmius tenuissimus]|nr:hypothetical protein PM082_007020 [Marasmius tenuissimus]
MQYRKGKIPSPPQRRRQLDDLVFKSEPNTSCDDHQASGYQHYSKVATSGLRMNDSTSTITPPKLKLKPCRLQL